MVNYTFYETKDLDKFLGIMPYEFKDRFPQLDDFRKRSYIGIEGEQDLTNHIGSYTEQDLHYLTKSVQESIKSKQEAIERLKQEITSLENITKKIDDCISFKDAFEVIINI